MTQRYSTARKSGLIPRPNIVYVCSDQHAFKYAGYAGHSLVWSPNLDRIAQEGVVFSNAYCGSPVCVPSRSCLMTGVYASDCNSFCNSTVWDGSYPTWGKRLREAGYFCRATGKMDLNAEFDMGFDLQETSNKHRVNPDITSLFRRPVGYRVGPRRAVNGWPRDERHKDCKIAENAVNFITREANGLNQPWLLYVGFQEPHPKFAALRQHYNRYPLEEIDLPVIPDEELDSQHLVYRVLRHLQLLDAEIPEERIRRARAGYYGMITEVDEYIGQIWNALEGENLLENTVFIYTSDHGESLGEHGLWNKSNLYENAAHVPMTVAGAGIPKNVKIETCVGHTDLAATLMALCGQEIPREFRGHSLVPMMEGTPGDHPGYAFCENHSAGTPTGSFMIRRSEWKYVHFTWYEDQLFNLEEDPNELLNRIDDPSAQGIVKELKAILFREVNPEEITRRAFQTQDRRLRDLTEGRSEDEIFSILKSRLGPGLARVLASRLAAENTG